MYCMLFILPGYSEVTFTESTVKLTIVNYESYLYPSTPYETCYPYDKLDFKAVKFKEKTGIIFKTLILENEYLKITILPEMGGRIYESIYKPANSNMFYTTNEVIPVRIYGGGTGYLLVIGGIKYAFPSFDHTPNNNTVWKYKVTKNEDKSISVLTYDTDMETDLKISETVTLRPGTSKIEINTLLENPTPYKRKYCYWLCAAMDNNDNMEFIYPTDRMITHTDDWGVPKRTLVSWPIYRGIDYSKFKNWDNQQGLFPFKNKNNFVGSYDHGKEQGIVRIYPPEIVNGTKVWCNPRDPKNTSQTFEIFGGLPETQDDYTYMEPKSNVQWKEYWYPIKDTAGFIYANSSCAINLKKTNEKEFSFFIASNIILNDVKLRFSGDKKDLLEKTINISPSESTKLQVISGDNFSNDSEINITGTSSDNKEVALQALQWVYYRGIIVVKKETDYYARQKAI